MRTLKDGDVIMCTCGCTQTGFVSIRGDGKIDLWWGGVYGADKHWLFMPDTNPHEWNCMPLYDGDKDALLAQFTAWRLTHPLKGER
jgi:hypothetical protein